METRCVPKGMVRLSVSCTLQLPVESAVEISCDPACITAGCPLTPRTVTSTSGCRFVGPMELGVTSVPAISSLNPPPRSVEYSWAANDCFANERRCRSDDRGKHAVVGQFEFGAGVGRANTKLSARLRLPRRTRRLFQREMGASRRAKRFDAGLRLFTAA